MLVTLVVRGISSSLVSKNFRKLEIFISIDLFKGKVE